MADIRKRDYKSGTKYQVRYPSNTTKSGYAFKTFDTLKEARAFQGEKLASPDTGGVDQTIKSVRDAISRWLEICLKEGRDGRDPVTAYTYKTYTRRADIMRAYEWSKPLAALQTPDVVSFRSWLLLNYSRDLARKTLTSFHAVIKEMALRGHIASNVAAGVSIRADSRYDTPIEIPTPQEVAALLGAADRLANSKNAQIARSWERYRPILYLAADTGMRPQEYLALARSCVFDGGVKVERAIERGGRKISVTKTPAGRRFIDVSPGTYEMVLHYADEFTAPNRYDLIFPTASGRWQETDNWRKRGFYKACYEAALIEQGFDVNGKECEKPKFSPYDLRHFYASTLIDRKINLKRIQTLMGHEDIKTTLNTYGHLIAQKDEQRERVDLVKSLPELSCGQSVAN